MKKLLYILLLSTLTFGFVACGSDDDNNDTSLEFDDWNDKRSPNYKPKGYNPIEGEWIWASSSNTKLIFTNDFIQKTEHKNNEGIWKPYQTLGTYKINDKEYKRNDGYIFPYTIIQEENRDILRTTSGTGTNTYYRYK